MTWESSPARRSARSFSTREESWRRRRQRIFYGLRSIPTRAGSWPVLPAVERALTSGSKRFRERFRIWRFGLAAPAPSRRDVRIGSSRATRGSRSCSWREGRRSAVFSTSRRSVPSTVDSRQSTAGVRERAVAGRGAPQELSGWARDLTRSRRTDPGLGRRFVFHRAGGNAGARRRVGQREDDDRPSAAPLRATRFGPSLLRRGGLARPGGSVVAPAAAGHPDRLPGPPDLAESEDEGGGPDSRAIACPEAPCPPGALREGFSPARSRGPAGRGRRAFPVGVLRRAETARGHRAGARDRPEATRLRRAGVGSGCLGRGADHQSFAGVAGEDRSFAPLYFARPHCRRASGRPRLGLVPGPDRGGRADGGDRPAPASPLYGGVTVRGTGSKPLLPTVADRVAQRHGARPTRGGGMRLPAPLPSRAPPLRAGGAAARGAGAGAPRLLFLPGRVADQDR